MATTKKNKELNYLISQNKAEIRLLEARIADTRNVFKEEGERVARGGSVARILSMAGEINALEARITERRAMLVQLENILALGAV